MAEEEIIEPEDSEESEQEREEVEKKKKEKDEKALERKKRIIEFLKKVEKVIVALIIIFVMLYTPYFIFEVIAKQKKIPEDPYVYQIPQQIEKDVPALFNTKEFRLNLNDLSTVIRAELSMAYNKNNSDLAEELTERKFEIEDRIKLIISSKSYYDINSADKRQFGLKKELINEINSILDKGHLEDMYFTVFLVTRIETSD